MSRILGVDYGERRIGLALSDPLQIIAKPLTVIDRAKTRDYISLISNIISEKNVISMVVGLPLTLKGKHSQQTKIVMAFVEELKLELEIPIDFIDERLSSVSAEKLLQMQNIKTGHDKGRVDETSASIILQEHLDSQT